MALIAFAVAWLVLPARSQEPDYKQVLVIPTNDAVLVRLPLTDVTGKVRAKERTPDGFGLPVAPSRTRLGADHYLEWQIGYDLPTTNSPSAVPQIIFTRKGETKYGHELSKILLDALRLGIVTTNDLQREVAALPRLAERAFEERETVQVETPQAPDETGFARAMQRVPQFIRMTDHGAVQIQLKPRQRAVGFQAMVYVCVPLDQVLTTTGTPRPAGPARTKETVYYRFDRENADFLLDIVRAFAMASRQHNEDIGNILAKILETHAAGR
ncbi:MAG: R.Pab1 family restriction endonuclease [Limisphaerales bacterium]